MVKNRTALIFIHKSLGELDWIAPFIKSEEAKEISFFIYLNKMGSGHEEKQQILEKYGLNGGNVSLLDNKMHSTAIYSFFDKRLQKIKKKVTWCKGIEKFFRRKNAQLPSYKQTYDFIFRDYQLRYVFELSCFLMANPSAKVVVFPHAVAIPRINTQFVVDGRPPKVKMDLWLENSIKAYQLPDVRELFFISGAPGLSAYYEMKGLFNPKSANILINTRNEFELHGCTKEAALERFDSILGFCQKNGLTAHIKHHPRDHELYLYRDIQQKYSCAQEYDGTLTNITMELRACLSFFSTSGLFLSARQVPVIDITPYADFKTLKPLALHYDNGHGKLTNDLMEIGVQERLDNLDVLLSADSLSQLSENQFEALKVNFPGDSNKKIIDRLNSL